MEAPQEAPGTPKIPPGSLQEVPRKLPGCHQEAPRKPGKKIGSWKKNLHMYLKKCAFIYLFLPVFVSLEFPVFPSNFPVLYPTVVLLLLFHSLVFQFHILSWISNLRFHGVNVLISTSFRDHGQKYVIWQCHSRFMVFLNTKKKYSQHLTMLFIMAI